MNHIISNIVNQLKGNILIFGIIAAIVSFLAQIPALQNLFLNDDFIHLYNMKTLPFTTFLFEPMGGHIFTVNKLIFYISNIFFKMDAKLYLLSALLFHGVNVLLLFYVIYFFTNKLNLSFLFSLLWGSCSLLNSTLGWYSSGPWVFPVTFILIILLDLAKIYQGSIKNINFAKIVKWLILIILAVNSFAVFLPFAMFIFVLLCFIIPENNQSKSKIVLTFSTLILIAPLYHIIYMNYLWMGIEKLPDAHLIFKYFYEICYTIFEMFCYSLVSLLAGPVVMFSKTANLLSYSLEWHYFKYYLFLISGILGILFIFIFNKLNTRDRFIVISFLFIIITTYALTAIGRLPFYLELGLLKTPTYVSDISHNRNYYFPLILLSICISILFNNFFVLKNKKKSMCAVYFFVLIIVISNFIAIERLNLHLKKLSTSEQRYTPLLKSKYDNVGEETIFLKNIGMDFNGFYPKHLFPGIAGYYFLMFDDRNDGKIFFVEDNTEIINKIVKKDRSGRMHKLLISPSMVPAGKTIETLQ